jgi:hypothetical protein
MDTIRNISGNRDNFKTGDPRQAIFQKMRERGFSEQEIAIIANANDLQEILLARRAKERARQRRCRATKRCHVTAQFGHVTQEKDQQNQQSCHVMSRDKEEGGILTYVEPMYVKPMYVEVPHVEVKHVEVTYMADFRKFYAAYPHKVGRAAAEKAFAKAIKKTTLEQILDGLRAYIASKPPDRPWCNPSTWLNQERWSDQPAPPVQPLAKPLTFREANRLHNRRIINEVCGKGYLNGTIASLRSDESPAENHPQERRELGPPAIRTVSEPRRDDFNF